MTYKNQYCTWNQILFLHISFTPHTVLMNRATNIPIVANPTHATTIKIALKKTRKQTIEISQYSAHGEQGGGSKEELINRREGTRGGKQRPPLSTVHLIFPRGTWRAVLFTNPSPFIIKACLWYREFVNAQGLEKRRGERWELESNARDSDRRREEFKYSCTYHEVE